MITITLPPELEEAVLEEAEQKGTTAELLTLDALQQRFLHLPMVRPLPEGATLADALSNYIGAVNSSDKFPEVEVPGETMLEFFEGYVGVLHSSEHIPGGAAMSQKTGQKFAEGMLEKRKKGKL